MGSREFKGNSLINLPDTYVIIDIETTGLDPTHCEIIEVAAIRCINGKSQESFSSLIKPHTPVDSFIESLTGISNAMLDTAPSIAEVLPDFLEFIGENIIVGHNVNFDINFLYESSIRCLNSPLKNDFCDTLRLCRKYMPNLANHKLLTIASHFEVCCDGYHRALKDCQMVNDIIPFIIEASKKIPDSHQKIIEEFTPESSNPFYKKRVSVKGTPQIYTYEFMKKIAQKCDCNFSDVFYCTCDFIIFSNYTYKRFIQGEDSCKFTKTKALVEAGTLTVLSEKEFYKMLNIPVIENKKSTSKEPLKASAILSETTDFDELHTLFEKTCVFTGTLEKMGRKQAMQIVANVGGINGDSVTSKTNFLILGNNDFCSSIKDGKSGKQKKAEHLILKGQSLQIISENVFYDIIEQG